MYSPIAAPFKLNINIMRVFHFEKNVKMYSIMYTQASTWIKMTVLWILPCNRKCYYMFYMCVHAKTYIKTCSLLTSSFKLFICRTHQPDCLLQAELFHTFYGYTACRQARYIVFRLKNPARLIDCISKVFSQICLFLRSSILHYILFIF